MSSLDEMIANARMLGYIQGHDDGYKKGLADGQKQHNGNISNDDLKIMMASARGTYDYGLDEAKRQRDEYKAERDYYHNQYDLLNSLIERFVTTSVDEYNYFKQKAEPIAAALQEAIEQRAQPHLAESLALAHQLVDQDAYTALDKIVQQVNSLGESVTPGHKLILAKHAIASMEGARYAYNMILIGLGFSEHTPSVCDHICRQLSVSTGQVDIKWINKLMSWLQEQDGDYPSKPETVKTWLEIDQQRRKKGENVLTFAMRNDGHNEKFLKRAKALRDLLEDQRRLLPPELAALISGSDGINGM